MVEEKVGIKESMSIKKETVDAEGKVVEKVFFFPDEGKSVEANSLEEAKEKIKKVKSDIKKLKKDK